MEGKNERICCGCARLPVHDGRCPCWAPPQDEAALRARAGRYKQRGPACGQPLRRHDVAGSRTDAEFGQEHLRNLATEIILLDRTMRALGPEAGDARRHLLEYVQTALKEANILEENPRAEASLDAAGISLREIRVSDEQKVAIWNDARQLYREVVRQRWVTLDQYGGTIPPLLITMVILWLAIIFASFGYRAPRNTIVTASLLLAACS